MKTIDLRRKKINKLGSENFSKTEDLFNTKSLNEQLVYEARLNKKAKSPSLLGKLFRWIVFLFFSSVLLYGSFFAYKIYSIGKKVSIENRNELTPSFIETMESFTDAEPLHLSGAEEKRINILLLGMAGDNKPGKFLTDTLMIASLDLQNNRVAFLSIPRDLYIKIPEENLQTKINSVYQYGLKSSDNDSNFAAQLIKETVANITGMNLHYYIVLNFDGFEKAINDIGGINITSERDWYDPRYPGPNYSYETFELSKGFHVLDGATALKYARERHNDPEGDFGRAKRQQQIIQATKNKLFSAETMFNIFALNNLLNTLGENIKTDIQPDEISSFYELARKLDTNNINNVVIDAWNEDSLLKVTHVQYGDIRAFVLVPRVGNYSEIQELAQNVFDLNKINRRKEAIATENASIAILNASDDFQVINKIKKVLQENLNYKNVEILANTKKSIFEKTIIYDYTDGQKPFTLDELATKLPAEVSYVANTEIKDTTEEKKFDMLVMIGKDLIEKYNMEENTIEDLNKAQDDQMYLNLLEK